MKRFLTILFLLPFFVFGQSLIKKNQVDTSATGLVPFTSANLLYAPLSAVTPAVTTPMIDGLSNVVAAYGVTRQKTGATKALRLRRSSDNTEQDFYFNTSGNLDPNVILNWLNGAIGYVKTWYDQSGGGHDATQTTTTLQPYLVFEDVPKIRFQFSGSNVGQSLNFTLGSAITANSASIFTAYRCMVGSAASVNNPALPGYVAQKSIIGGASVNFELYAGATASDYDAIRIASGGTAQSSVNLYEYSSPNYVAIQSGSGGGKITSNYKTATFTNLGTGTETTLTIGNSNAGLTPFAGDFYNFIVFNTSVSDPVIAGLASLSKTQYNLVDGAVSPLNVGVEGDSQSSGITSTNNQNYPTQLLSTKRNYLFDMGIQSNGISDIVTKAVHVDRNIVAGKTNVLIVWIGTNDITGGTTGATEYAALKSYCDARTTAGWNQIYVLTMIPRGPPGAIETQRLAYNTAIRGNGNVDWTGVIDVGADTRFAYTAGQGGTGIYTYDTMFLSDGIHPTNVGYGIIAQYVDNTISTLSNTETTPTITSRVSVLESAFSNLPTLFTANTPAFTLGIPNLAVSGNAFLPNINGGTKPNTVLTLQGSTAAGAQNQGNVIIGPNGDRVYIGGTGFSSGFVIKAPYNSATTFNLNLLNSGSGAVQLNFGSTENNGSYLSSQGISWDGTNVMRLMSQSTWNMIGNTVNFFQTSLAQNGQIVGNGHWGFGTTASTVSPFTFLGTPGNTTGQTALDLAKYTMTYAPTGFGGASFAFNGLNFQTTFAPNGGNWTAGAVINGINEGLIIASIGTSGATVFGNTTGANLVTTFNHTTGTVTIPVLAGAIIQNVSTSAQNVVGTTTYGAWIRPFTKSSSGTISGTNGYGIYLDDWSGSGLFTNQYAIYSANTSPSVLNGALQLIPLTASKVVFTDASKNLTSTGIGTSLQYIAGDGSLATIGSRPHTIFTPTTGGTVTLTNNQYNIINPSGALLALTVTLPSSPANNDCVFIKFTQNVTTVTYAGGTVVDGITAPTAGGLTVLVFDQSSSSWY